MIRFSGAFRLQYSACGQSNMTALEILPSYLLVYLLFYLLNYLLLNFLPIFCLSSAYLLHFFKSSVFPYFTGVSRFSVLPTIIVFNNFCDYYEIKIQIIISLFIDLTIAIIYNIFVFHVSDCFWRIIHV